MKLTTMTRAQIAFIIDHPQLRPHFETTATTITVVGAPEEALKALTEQRNWYMGRNRQDQLVASASIVRKLTKAINKQKES